MSRLRIEILDGPSATQLADRLRAKDDDGLVTVEVVDEPGRAAFVIAVADHSEAANGVADAVLDASAPLAEQLDLLWDNRIDRTRDKTAFFDRVQHDYEQPSRNDD